MKVTEPTADLPTPLVAAEWLAGQLGRPDLVVLDASWYLAAMHRNPEGEYRQGHIPGALFWDLDRMSDQHTALPHMLPDAETFGRSVGALGIGNEDRIVVYDGSGTQLSAPRVWWTFRVFGHRHVAVLDGGMVRWKRRGLPTAMGTASRSPTSYQAVFHPEMVRSAEEVRRRLGDRQVQLLDARAPGRFAGTEPEPRPGIRSGHIPGAKNLPYTALTHADGTFLDPEALAEQFREAGIDLDRPVVTSCGSGVTACVLALGLELTGHPDYAVYDGSWTEWGGRSDLPIEK